MVNNRRSQEPLRGKKTILITTVVIAFIAVSIFVVFYNNSDSESFSKTSLVRLNIPLNGESTYKIKIFNYKDTAQDFDVSFIGLKDLAYLEKKKFSLDSKESEEIVIYFKDRKNQVGIYTGKLVIKTLHEEETISVMVGVEDVNSVFAIIQKIIPKYDNVYPGGKFGIDVRVIDVKSVGVPSIKAEHFIKNFEDEIIFPDQENFDLIVEGSVPKIVNIPKSWSKGDYVFITLIDYKGVKSVAGYFFEVSDKEDDILPANMKFFMIIILIFVIGILASFFYFIKTRDDVLLQLKRQQDNELKRNLDLIKCSKVEVKKLKHPGNKIVQLKKVKEKIIKKIKSRQKLQRKELKKLKKKGKKSLIQVKLKSWERQGYKLVDAEKEVKKVTKNHIDEQMKNWKQKGYKIGFLNK